MKRSILALITFGMAMLAYAGPDSMVVLKRNSDDTGTQQLLVGPPSTPGFLTFDPTSPTFTTLGDGLAWSGGILSATAPAQVNADWNASSGFAQILNKPSIPASQVNSDVTAVSGMAQILNKPTIPTIPTRSFSYTTRSLNTCFQVSSSRDAFVSYSVDIATSLSLTTGQQGTVYMRIYTNSGCTTGTQEVTRFVNGQTGTLTIGLALTQNVTATLNGMIPAGMWVQLVTENNTGTPTFTARPGQEVLL